MKGKVFSGEGKASEFLRLEPYAEFLEDKLGEKVFPGTLNLRADKEAVKKLKNNSEHYRMDETVFEGRELGGIDVYCVKLQKKPALVVEPDLTRYGDDVLEVVAAEKLRKQLDLEDGDRVTVEPE